jgi:hypothetical protein
LRRYFDAIPELLQGGSRAIAKQLRNDYSDCDAIIERLKSDREVIEEPSQSDCDAISMRFQSYCKVVVERLRSDCETITAIAMRFKSDRDAIIERLRCD